MENLNPEKLICCPYDKSHQIMASRFQRHLYKCAKQHPNIKMVQCPYNITHFVKPEDAKEHKRTCPDSWKFEKFMLENAPSDILEKQGKKLKMPKYEVEEEESWDHYNVESYNPEEKINEYPILRSCHGKTKKEREAFRAKENDRIQTIWKNKPYLGN